MKNRTLRAEAKEKIQTRINQVKLVEACRSRARMLGHEYGWGTSPVIGGDGRLDHVHARIRV